MITHDAANILTAPRTRFALLASALVMVVGFSEVMHAASIRFLPVGDEVAERKIGLQDGKKLIPLEDLSVRKRSKAYTCKIDKKPIVLVALDRQRPNGQPSGVDVTIAPEMKSPLVLILASADAPSGMRVMVLEDGNTDFPWGSLRFINTTEKPFMIRCENETKPLPGELKPIDINPGGEERNLGVQLFTEAEPDALLYSAVWEHDPNLRKLIFIAPQADPAQKELKLEVIPQDKRAKN